MIQKTLLDLSDKDLGATGGTAYSNPLEVGGIGDLGSLGAFLHAKKEGGSSPTLDVSFEVSWDKTNWVASGLEFTQVTTSTDSNEGKMWGSNLIAPYVRAKYVIGGTNTPTYDVLIIISALGAGYWGA